MEESQLTIIIPTLATELSTRGLNLAKNSMQTTSGSPIVIALNNQIEDREMQALGNNVSWFWTRKQGQCQAVNKAVRMATTPWLMVTNDDMVFPPGWFQELTYWIENYGLLVASPNLVEPRKGAPPFVEHFCGGLGTVGMNPDFNLDCYLDFVKTYKEHTNNPDRFIENGWNLPFIIRKDVWDTVGGYDEAYDPWSSCSDTDLQTKLMVAGIVPKRIRSVLVYHFGKTSGTFSPENESYKYTNWRYYENKWGFPSFKNPDVWYLPTIPYEKLKYHPSWENKYENNYPQVR